MNDDDFDVLASGTAVGRIVKAAAAPVSSMVVDPRLRPARKPRPDARG